MVLLIEVLFIIFDGFSDFFIDEIVLYFFKNILLSLF